jgi:hypothetical protein
VKPALIFLLLNLAWTSCHAQDGSLDIVGEAFDQNSGEFLYREMHDCTENAETCSIEYRDQTGQVFATKLVDYSGNPWQPRLSMKNLRAAEQFDYQPTPDMALVADAGFDNFVRGNWEDLQAGQTVNFRFVVLGMARPLKMNASEESATQCTGGNMCLKIALDSWLLKRFVDPIRLEYSRKEKRLLRFSGISNIKGVDGESLNVDILYRYSEEEELSRVF